MVAHQTLVMVLVVLSTAYGAERTAVDDVPPFRPLAGEPGEMGGHRHHHSPFYPEASKAEAKAMKALFKAHPEFAGFPNMNGSFSVYKMHIEDIFLVNKPAPARNLTVEAYLGAY